jgi:hydroxyacylglutathione hydrolase
MIGDRLKRAARRVGRRLLLPEERASVRVRSALARGDGPVDRSVIPRIQQGDGDTPGPNHPTDIGRTWAAAQLAGREGIVALDIRSPAEWASGHLPGAVLVPRELLADHLDAIPGHVGDTFVAVYDATGDQGSAHIADLLRERGFPRARRLVGGFAEWVEEGEEVVMDPPSPGGPQIGDSVATRSGVRGAVWRITGNGEPRYGVLVQTSPPSSLDCAASELSR